MDNTDLFQNYAHQMDYVLLRKQKKLGKWLKNQYNPRFLLPGRG
jgi:hypothetical protein